MMIFSEAGQEAFREIYEVLGANAALKIIVEDEAKKHQQNLEALENDEEVSEIEKENDSDNLG